MAGVPKAIRDLRDNALRQLSPVATASAMWRPLGYSGEDAVKLRARKIGVPAKDRATYIYPTAGNNPLGEASVQQAIDVYLKTGNWPEHVDMFFEPARRSRKGAMWTTGQWNDVLDRVGTEPLAQIAASHSTTRTALYNELRQRGEHWRVYEYSGVKLVKDIYRFRGLRLAEGMVRQWCQAGQVRGYKEHDPGLGERRFGSGHVSQGNVWIVDIDDYHWLLDNWQPYEGFADHPGKDETAAILAFIAAHNAAVLAQRREQHAKDYYFEVGREKARESKQRIKQRRAAQSGLHQEAA